MHIIYIKSLLELSFSFKIKISLILSFYDFWFISKSSSSWFSEESSDKFSDSINSLVLRFKNVLKFNKLEIFALGIIIEFNFLISALVNNFFVFSKLSIIQYYFCY